MTKTINIQLYYRNESYVWCSNNKMKPYLRKYQPFIVDHDRGVKKFDWKDKKIRNAYSIARVLNYQVPSESSDPTVDFELAQEPANV